MTIPGSVPCGAAESRAPSKQTANRATYRLQAVQVLRAKRRGPGPHFVLRESEPRVRIVVADAVQRRLSFVIGDPQEKSATVARHERTGSDQQSLLLQALAISSVRVNVLQHFFQRFCDNEGWRARTCSLVHFQLFIIVHKPQILRLRARPIRKRSGSERPASAPLRMTASRIVAITNK